MLKFHTSIKHHQFSRRKQILVFLFFSLTWAWQRWAYSSSGIRCRRRRRQQCLNIFSSETALPIKAKLYVEPPWEGGTKVYINGPGHMTKMATMPIYGKNL